VDVNHANAAGDTALHTAAAGGSPAVVRFLAAKGARLDIKNKADRTPLEAAEKSRQPNAEVIAILKALAVGN
jgi:ankyrin repeat protein